MTPGPPRDALRHPLDALAPPGHFRNLILHNNHSLVSPPVEYPSSTYLRFATVVPEHCGVTAKQRYGKRRCQD